VAARASEAAEGMPRSGHASILTEAEIDRLMKAGAVSGGRWGHRNATMILVAFRHGLRVGELVSLRWDQVDFATAHLHVNRLKARAREPASRCLVRNFGRLRQLKARNRRQGSRFRIPQRSVARR